MHIVQILPALDEGGVERGTVELNRAFVQRGHRSTVISSGGRLVASIEAAGGHHVRLPVKSKNPLTAFSRASQLAKALKKLNPDVVHYRSRVPGWLCQIANRELHFPTVSTVHGFNSVSFYSKVMTMGGRVICPSTPIIDYIRKNYQTPMEKIRLVYRGIDPDAFDPEKLDHEFIEDFKKKFGLADSFIVLGVGRITQLKGYDVLIKATALAVKKIPNLTTVIVGEAEAARQEYAQSLHELVKEVKMEKHVVFAGNQKKMAEIYSCGNVLVSGNSTKPEAFGRTMAEALSMNCPVVATRFGGALDVVRDGRDGWLITPGNVEELADRIVQVSSAHLSNLREGAMERFSLQQMVDKTLAVYQEVARTKA